VVVHTGPEHEEAKQHADAHSVVLDHKTAGRQLNVLAAASCCSKTCLAHRYFEAQSRYAVGVDDELHRWSVVLVHSQLVAVHAELDVPAQAAHGQEQNPVVRETRIATVH
jgi:hypothetical protein